MNGMESFPGFIKVHLKVVTIQLSKSA